MRRPLISAAGVLLCASAILGGNAWRSHVDHPAYLTGFRLDGMQASNSTETDFGAVDFFHEMAALLKREYVDPITDEQKLASGAVRGMIGSLGDPNSLYFDKDQFKNYQKARSGVFEGIGAEFSLRLDAPPSKENRAGILPNPQDEGYGASTGHAPRIPEVVVTAIARGGPAEKAGVKVGDVVSQVDGHDLVNVKMIDRLRDAQKQYQAQTITRQQYAAIHKEIRLALDDSILPLRAIQRLSSGTSGKAQVVWTRGGVTRQTDLAKASTTVPTFEAQGNAVTSLRFTPGVAEKLKGLAAEARSISIDLRNNVIGDYSEMRKCLAALAPAGTYGYVVSHRDRKPETLTISGGNAKPPKVRLIVDKSTGGPAEIFALALEHRGVATLSSREMSPDRDVVETFTLPDGSGYSVVKGQFSVTPSAKDRQWFALAGSEAQSVDPSISPREPGRKMPLPPELKPSMEGRK